MSVRALLLLLATGVLCTCGVGSKAPPPATGKPDIVLVVIDTTRADDVDIYGSPRATTPAIDALARDGAWFYRAYSQSGWTLPSFASLLTGLYPFEHRVGRAPHDYARFGRLASSFTTLPEALTAAGYRCGAIVNNTFLAPEFGLNQGFDAGYNWRGADDYDIRRARATVTAALAWISRQPPPFFLMVHFMDPHAAYDPPPSTRGAFTGTGPPPVPVPFPAPGQLQEVMDGQLYYTPAQWRYIRKLYDEEILAVDHQVGRLVRALRARSRWNDTLIAVTADHGEEFQDHGGYEHGNSLYGELTRVPLVLHGPGVGHGRIDTVVSHVDLFQGLIAAAGAKRPVGTHGRDLLAISRDQPHETGRMAFSENTLYGPPLVSIVSDHYRLVVNELTGGGELWKVALDGSELRRVRGPAARKPVRRLLAAMKKLRGDLKPVPVASGPRIESPKTFSRLKALGYLE